MFVIGDRIAHPVHGAGIIEAVSERVVDGIRRSYYLVRIPYNGMTVMIPCENTGDVGVRPIMDDRQAKVFLLSIPGIPVEDAENWNRRYRENVIRLKSGDLRQVCAVFKGLVLRNRDKGLSNGERRLLAIAKQIVYSELMLASSIDHDEAEKLVMEMMITK